MLSIASSAQADRIASFQMPSRNILCEAYIGSVAQTNVQCGIKSGLVGARPAAHCSGGDPSTSQVWLPAGGRGARVDCAGDPGPFLNTHAPILEYGRTWVGGAIRCASARHGLTCTNRQGHGFFLSRERWRVW